MQQGREGGGCAVGPHPRNAFAAARCWPATPRPVLAPRCPRPRFLHSGKPGGGGNEEGHSSSTQATDGAFLIKGQRHGGGSGWNLMLTSPPIRRGGAAPKQRKWESEELMAHTVQLFVTHSAKRIDPRDGGFVMEDPWRGGVGGGTTPLEPPVPP